MRQRKELGFWIGVILAMSPNYANAGKIVQIPFVTYETNQKYVRTGERYGWTTRFQNGAPEEQGKLKEAGFLQSELAAPKGAGPFPFVILMHGCGGLDTTARKWATMWTEYLAGLNVGTLILDSFRTRGVRSTCGPPDGYWSRRRVDDAYSALDFLVTRSEAKPDQIYVMGRSNGGRAVLNALQSEYRAMRQNLFSGGISLYGNCESRKRDDFYAPLLLLVAELDDANPAAHCHELADKKRPADHPELQFVLYPGVFHGFDDGSPVRTFNGWRLGGNLAAGADAKRRAKEFLARHGAVAP